MSVTYTSATARESVRWTRELTVPSPRFWTVAKLVLGLALVWLVGLQIAANGWPGAWPDLALGAAAAVALLAATPVGTWYAVRQLERQSAAVLGRPVTLSIADEGLHLASGHSSRVIGWPDITGIEVHPEFLLVRGKVQVLVVVPVRAFPSPAGAEALVDAVRRRLGGAAV